jgi:alpha-glucosidase
MYRTALRLRRELGLGSGSLSWVDTSDHVLAFRVRTPESEVLVLTNFGPEPVPLSAVLPPEAVVLHASAALDDGKVPTDVTIWARPSA